MLEKVQTLSLNLEQAAVFDVPATTLEARDVSVTFGERDIVRNVSLSIRANEILAIIGPSGCGKSTFITALNGMLRHTLPAATKSGTILLEGTPVSSSADDSDMLRQRVAMVFQRPNPFPFSIRRNLEFALKAAKFDKKAEYADRIEAVLRSVNLWDRLKDRMKDSALCLSGGEQQRLCIARALISNPNVILFDEPCSALDPVSCNAIEELILALKDRCAIAVVTHNIAQASRISDRCAVFWLQDDSGQIIETGPTETLMRNPKNSITRSYINGECC